ncbi:hypothetical protein Rsub_03387 [Raphidocelis subcapitata]|uniref:GTPase n=1 Tax=Raphidocelis subcapitata TaxID=307507 RepID=A0A2V0NRI7_9CHLO|nr:hypothetical protein Rsub_03387 [Raphidocelis subcapitata]|eukprot:GBF90254.1 hypothetical protein Rsub_03387 [Raphidocelis subcapitata]
MDPEMDHGERILILGAAGRDYHTFNTLYRASAGPDTVVGFTHAASQIPVIASTRYPPSLAGPRYPRGLPIWGEGELEAVVAREGVTRAVLAYSDLSYSDVMALAARARAAAASFELLRPEAGMLRSQRPVLAVTATRTGCGKSQVCGLAIEAARAAGLVPVVIRHPMPYGVLEEQAVQRFETPADLERHNVTLEEREEYEQHLARGVVVYAGVDYAAILAAAEAECDVVIADGGNNDVPFFKPDLWVCVADPFRPRAQETHYPGDANFRRAGVIVVNKANTAPKEGLAAVAASAARLNPSARLIATASEVTVACPAALRGRRVVVLEDGPTLTHGGLATGAGFIAASKYGAQVVDPRPHFVGALAATLKAFPHIGPVVPAMGYSEQQAADLATTLAAVPADAILCGSPIDLARALGAARLGGRPVVQASYGLDPLEVGGGAELAAELGAFFGRAAAARAAAAE